MSMFIVGELKGEILELDVEALIYIEVKDNYFHVHYEQNGFRKRVLGHNYFVSAVE